MLIFVPQLALIVIVRQVANRDIYWKRVERCKENWGELELGKISLC